MTNDQGLKALIVEFDDFIRETPTYGERRLVRDYQHEIYQKWAPLRDAVLAAPSPSLPSREAIAAKVRELADFLDGKTGVEDVFFGDPHPRTRGMFWWRVWMRETLDEAANVLSLLPVNGWMEGVEAAAKVADNLAAHAERCQRDYDAYTVCADRIRALSAAPGEGAGNG